MPVPCQVRSKTESPCPRRAVAEMRGVAFCGPCAREQEAYFAIGELTQDETQRLHSEPLAEALGRLRRERTLRMVLGRCYLCRGKGAIVHGTRRRSWSRGSRRGSGGNTPR